MRYLNYALSILISAVLSLFGLVFAGIPLRYVRLMAGSRIYWLFTCGFLILLTIKAPPLAILFLMPAVQVGLLTELEANGEPLFMAGALSTIAAYVAGLAGFVVYGNWLGKPALLNLKTETINFMTSQMQNAKDLPVNWADTLLWQAPSMLLVLLALSAAVVFCFDRYLVNLGAGKRRPLYVLDEFSVPDGFIWVLLAAVLFSFLDGVPRWSNLVGMNVLNVMIVLYFFQGMAVVQHLYRAMQMGPMWRAITSLILVLHLFLLVSAVGAADFWLNFRHRLRKSENLRKAFKQGE